MLSLKLRLKISDESKCSDELCLRPRRKAFEAGPRRDIVGMGQKSVEAVKIQFSDKFGTFEHQILKPHRKTKRNTSFEPKKEKAPTHRDFENFDLHPQLGIKF